MRRLLEKLSGKENQMQNESDQNTENTTNPDNTIQLKELIEQEAHYELDDDDRSYFSDFQKFEHQKAKLWTKPDFQSHLLVYTKLRYNKALTMENISSYRVYKRLYQDKIRNSQDISLYQKVLFHPDLTQMDYEFIQAENRKVVRNAGIIELMTIGSMGYCYFKTKMREKRGFYAIFLLAPAFALFGGFALEKYRFKQKLYRVELDKKYNIPS